LEGFLCFWSFYITESVVVVAQPSQSCQESTPRATEECFMTTCDAAAAAAVIVFIARALRGL